jgi:hypothetical protein
VCRREFDKFETGRKKGTILAQKLAEAEAARKTDAEYKTMGTFEPWPA